MRTSNPALNHDVFVKERNHARQGLDKMTINGVINSTFLLLFLTFASAAFSWYYLQQGALSISPGIMIGSAIGALIIAFVIIFKKTTAPYLAPIYCLIQGVLLGSISLVMEMQFPGIVTQAILATFGVALGLLLLYRSRIIQVTEKFKMGVAMATFAICFVYLISIVLGFFGVQIPMIHESGPIGIGFSVVVVIVASLNLLLDFDFIEKGASLGSPKYMNWYAAFGLMVTLIWLYLEILRLLSKLRDRR